MTYKGCIPIELEYKTKDCVIDVDEEEFVLKKWSERYRISLKDML